MKRIRRAVFSFACVTAALLLAVRVDSQPVGAPGPAAPPRAVVPSAPPVTPVMPAPAVTTAEPAAPSAPAQSAEVRRWPGPVFQLGQDVTLPPGQVARELAAVLADARIEGVVEREAIAVLGNVHLGASARVDGNLIVIAGDARIDPGAIVSGDLVVVGGSLAAPGDFSPGGDSVVAGAPALTASVRAFVPWVLRGLLLGRLIVPGIVWVWLVVAVGLLVYLAVNTLFHGSVGACADAVQERPLSVFLLGLLVLLLTVPVILILAATVIGLIVVPFLLSGLVVAGLAGKAGVARAIGRALLRREAPESRVDGLLSFAVGSAVLVACYVVPILGMVVWSLTCVLAVGSSAVMLRARMRRERPAPEPSATEPLPQFSRIPEEAEAPMPPPASPVAPPDGSRVAAADVVAGSRAAFLDRVAAFALDCLLVAIVVRFLGLSRHDGAFPLLLIAYHVAFWAWKGTTLGGIVVGLRVLRQQGTELRFVDALVRGLSALFSVAALGIGCFWMINDPQRQMWHDKIAGTLVLKVSRDALLS